MKSSHFPGLLVRRASVGPRAFALAASFIFLTSDLSLHAESPPGHFTVSGDGTVYDTMTGLLWEREPTAEGMNSAAGRAYCEGLPLAGRTWRLPSVTELLTIVDLSATGDVKIDAKVFSATQTRKYQTWPPSGFQDAIWAVLFGDGVVFGADPDDDMSVRCVAVEGRQ